VFLNIRWRILLPFTLLVLAVTGASGWLIAHFAEDATTVIVVSLAIAALLAILLSILISHTITRPIGQVTRAAQRIAEGDLDQNLTIEANDEAARLARAFNEMAARLRRNIGTMAEERNNLATTLQNMADGVIMTDREGAIVLANPAAAELFGFQEEAAIGRHFIEVVRDHDIDDVVKSCLNTQQEQNIQLESGTAERFLRVIAIPLMDGEPNGTLVMFQDLTELRSLQTMRREFVGNVSHELRSPLAAIKAIVETLEEGAIDDKGAACDFLSRMHGEVERMTQMVGELSELSRIETGRAELTRVPENLNLLVEEVVARLKPQAERQGVALSTELPTELPAVPIDRERIQQVLTNLVHNAIKFTGSGGRAVVSVVQDKEAVVVSVADTGIGISRDDLPRVFERFYKADKARSGEGTGLGLAIAKHIVQAHGGSIWADSQEGKGSTFSFSLPLNPELQS
jgi:two-component system phosphate regulon sensor histidine kinase PhoR